MQRSNHFPIASYKSSSDLILRLKATGAKQENFAETDFWNDSNCQPITGVWFDIKNTPFTLRHEDENTVTLYLGQHAICKTTSTEQAKYIKDSNCVFTETMTSVINMLPLSGIPESTDPNRKYFYFLVGNKKPADLAMKHLSYLGLDASSLELKEDQLWYIKIPQISLFEMRSTEEYSHGSYLELLYCQKQIAGTHISNDSPIAYNFFVHTFRIPTVSINELVYEQAIDIKEHYLGGLEFTGTIKAFNLALAKKEGYSVLKLESLQSDYTPAPFSENHARLFCETIFNNTDLKRITFFEMELSAKSLLLMLKAIRTITNLRELVFQNIEFESKVSLDLLQSINDLLIDIPTEFYCGDSKKTTSFNNFVMISDLKNLNAEQNSYFSLLPRQLFPTVNSFLFFKPEKVRTELLQGITVKKLAL